LFVGPALSVDCPGRSDIFRLGDFPRFCSYYPARRKELVRSGESVIGHNWIPWCDRPGLPASIFSVPSRPDRPSIYSFITSRPENNQPRPSYSLPHPCFDSTRPRNNRDEVPSNTTGNGIIPPYWPMAEQNQWTTMVVVVCRAE
jgi:hypothetical protein